MKHINKTKYLWIICMLSLIGLSSCKKNHKHSEHEGYHSVVDKFKGKGRKYRGTSISSDKYLNGISKIEITENEITFYIPTRKNKIKSYKCTECHTEPINRTTPKDIRKAHWHISLDHANSDAMNCFTCHNGKDMNHLKSLTGKQIDFDRSYKLCAQCHQKQFKDWSGGAHGKRIKSWASPRLSNTCVNCHNPHAPNFDKRLPSRFNTQKVKERE